MVVVGAAEMESLLTPWDGATSTGGAAVPMSYSLNMWGQTYTYCNDSYHEHFLKEGELAHFNARRLCGPLLWGKALSPENHPAFFSAVIQGLCSTDYPSGECSVQVKVRGGEGKGVIWTGCMMICISSSVVCGIKD